MAGKGLGGVHPIAGSTAVIVVASWSSLLFQAHLGAATAALPFALMLGAAGATIVSACAQGRPWGIGILFIFAFFGLSFGLRTDGYARTGGLDWQNLMKLAAWLLVFVICPFHIRRLLPFLREKAVVLASLYALTAFASAAWSLIPTYTAANALGLISYLILACLCVSILGADGTLRLLLFTLLVFLSVGSVSGVLLPETAWLAPSVDENVYRLRAFSGHPNVLGAQAALLVTLALILRRRKIINSVVLVLCLLIGMTAIAAADSRTMLAATVGTALFTAMRERRHLLVITLAGLTGVVIAVTLLALGWFPDLSGVLGPLARTGSISEFATLTGRTELWVVSLELIGQKPFFGWGFGGTEALLIGSVGRTFQGAPVNAHNMYIQLLFNLGWLGSLSAIALLWVLVARMFHRPDAARDQVVLLVMVIGLTEVSIFALPVLLTFCFFIIIAREAVTFSTPIPEPLTQMQTVENSRT